MSITISKSDLNEINKTFKKLDVLDKSKLFKEFSDYVRDRAIDRADTHTKTGAMIKSIFKRKVSDGYVVGSDKSLAPYAVFVHWGSKPHIIKPKKKKALRWAGGGVFHFAKEIHHPGYKGEPFLTLALDDGVKKLPEFFNRLTKEI